MTTTDRDAMTPDPLPGLEDYAPATMPAVEVGVRRTLAALAERQALTESDAGKTALAISLAQVIHTKMLTGRLSTVGVDARILLDLLNDIAGADAAADRGLAEVMRDWQETVDNMDRRHVS